MTRSWLLTSTTYGTWLPGDRRGYVSRVENGSGPRVLHNQFSTPYDQDTPGLLASAHRLLKCPPIFLTAEQAIAVLAQFRETAAYRGWHLHAAAVMANHFHIVVTTPDDALSADILGDFKSYASRALNRRWAKPASGTWWTASGSRRPLPGWAAVEDASGYVRDQPGALAVWVNEESSLL